MKIERNGQIIELTDEELRNAFYEQQHIFLLMDAQEYLEQELRRRFVLEGESDSMLDTVIRAYYGYGFNALICEDSGYYALEELVRLFQKWQSTEDGGWYTWASIINDYIDEEMHKVDEPGLYLLKEEVIEQLEMWSKEEYDIALSPDDDSVEKINFYLPVVFDPDEAFGLDVCGEHNDDYINLYLDWYPADKHIELTVSYIGRDCDECFKVNLTNKQYQRLAERLPEICKDAYGKTPEEICEETEKFLSVTLPVPSADYIPELIEET